MPDTTHTATRLLAHIDALTDDRAGSMNIWLRANMNHLHVAHPDRTSDHHTWAGGLLDYTVQLLDLVDILHASLSAAAFPPVNLDTDSAKVVLAVAGATDLAAPHHDKASTRLDNLLNILYSNWGVCLDAEERHALASIAGTAPAHIAKRSLPAFCLTCHNTATHLFHDRTAAPSAPSATLRTADASPASITDSIAQVP